LTANAASVEPGKVERLLAWRRYSKGPDEGRKLAGAGVSPGGQRNRAGKSGRKRALADALVAGDRGKLDA
jgi:hypothetical protein